MTESLPHWPSANPLSKTPFFKMHSSGKVPETFTIIIEEIGLFERKGVNVSLRQDLGHHSKE